MDVTLPHWWAVAARGYFALVFGAVAWVWPRVTLTILIVFFGVYALQDGIFAVVSSVRAHRQKERAWPVALEGIFGIAVGVATLSAPAAGAALVALVIALWALGTGALEVLAGIRLRREIKGEWLMVLGGVLRLVFGGVVLARPGAGLLALVWTIAAYAVAHGVVLVGLSIRLKRRETPGGMTPQLV